MGYFEVGVFCILQVLVLLCSSGAVRSREWQLDRIVMGEERHALPGDAVALPCSTVPKVSYLKGQKTFAWFGPGDVALNLSATGPFHLDTEIGTLGVPVFNVSTDVGEYYCHVSNPTGTLRGRTVHLKEAVAPRGQPLLPVDKEVVVGLGESVRLSCYSSDFQPAAEYNWNVYRGSHNESTFTGTIGEHPALGKRLFVLSYGVLQITRVTEDLLAEYECTGSNAAGSKTTIFTLKLRADNSPARVPTIKPPLGRVYAKNGSWAVIECGVTGSGDYRLKSFAKKTEGQRRHKAKPVDLPEPQGRYYVNITEVTLSHRGVYVCVLTPKSGNGSDVSKRIRLTVYAPPRFSVTGKVFEYVKVPKKSDAVLTCAQKMDTVTKFSWYFNGVLLATNMNMPSYTVKNNKVNQHGFYQCFMNNKFGLGRKTFVIQVTSKNFNNAPPLPVEILEGEAEATAITVRWRAYDYWRSTERTLVAFTVTRTLRNNDTDSDERVIIVENHCRQCKGRSNTPAASADLKCLICSYKFDKLLSETDYEITVQGFTSFAAGNISEKLPFTTKTAAPSLPPSNQTHHYLGSAALLIKWGQIPLRGRGGEVLRYQVMYRRYKAGDIKYEEAVNVTLPEDKNFYVISYTEPGERYQYRVLGATKAGFGNMDDSVDFWKVATIPPAGVYSIPSPVFHLEEANSTHVMVDVSRDPSVYDWPFYYVIGTTAGQGSTVANVTTSQFYIRHSMADDGWIDVTIAYFDSTGSEHSDFVTQTLGVNCQKPIPTHLNGSACVSPSGYLCVTVHWRYHKKCPTQFHIGYRRVEGDTELKEEYADTTELRYNFATLLPVENVTDFPVRYDFRVLAVRGEGVTPAQSNVHTVIWRRAPLPGIEQLPGSFPIRLEVTVPSLTYSRELIQGLSLRLRYQEIVFPEWHGDSDPASDRTRWEKAAAGASNFTGVGGVTEMVAPSPEHVFELRQLDLASGRRYRIAVTSFSDQMVESLPMLAFTSGLRSTAAPPTGTTEPLFRTTTAVGPPTVRPRPGDGALDSGPNTQPNSDVSLADGAVTMGVSEQTMGIVIAVGLSVVCIFICMVLLFRLWRRVVAQREKRRQLDMHARGFIGSSRSPHAVSYSTPSAASYISSSAVSYTPVNGAVGSGVTFLGLHAHAGGYPHTFGAGLRSAAVGDPADPTETQAIMGRGAERAAGYPSDDDDDDDRESEKDSMYSSDKTSSSSSKNTFRVDGAGTEESDSARDELLPRYPIQCDSHVGLPSSSR